MSTCLFTGEPTGPHTAEEHTIPRGLCGRFRTRRSSSTQFNNWSSQPFDAELVASYSVLVLALAPLLSAEHQPGGIEVTGQRDGERLVLAPGAVPVLKETHILERDPATGRPTSMLGKDEDRLRKIAAQAGWPAEQVRIEKVPSTEAAVVYAGVRGMSPAIEIAVLKAALLTFDHLLEQREDAFTRARELLPIREEILRIVRDGKDAASLIAETSWGIDPDDLPDLRTIRGLYAPPALSEFEHVLLVSGTRGANVDLYFLVAGVDLFRYRLSPRWSGSTFALLCGAGMLAGDVRFGPIAVHKRFPFRKPTELRALLPAGALDTEAGREKLRQLNHSVTAPRHEAVRRATSLVEHRADDFVKGQLAELIVVGEVATIGGAIRARLARLYRGRLDEPEVATTFGRVVDARLSTLPDSLPNHSADTIDWQVWLPAHRDLARTLEVAIGLPNSLCVKETHVGIGETAPPRRRT